MLEENTGKIDIAILDVEMDNINGIEAGYEILERNPDAALIIITSFMQYIDEAFDLRVFRYYEKPVNKDRLFSALDKILREDKIYELPVKDGIINIGESRIACIGAYKRKTIITTDAGEEIETNLSIKKWLEILEKNDTFASPHYSFIINLKFVKECTSESVVVLCKNGKEIPIYPSKRKYTDFKRQFLRKMRDYK